MRKKIFLKTKFRDPAYRIKEWAAERKYAKIHGGETTENSRELFKRKSHNKILNVQPRLVRRQNQFQGGLRTTSIWDFYGLFNLEVELLLWTLSRSSTQPSRTRPLFHPPTQIHLEIPTAPEASRYAWVPPRTWVRIALHQGERRFFQDLDRRIAEVLWALNNNSSRSKRKK